MSSRRWTSAASTPSNGKGRTASPKMASLFIPPNFSRDKKYPLVVYLHGAPQFAASATDFDFLLQLFASHGYVVFAPNYLGTR